MEEIVEKEVVLEAVEPVDPRPKCFLCIEEKRERPEIGFLYPLMSDGHRHPVCGEHIEKLVSEKNDVQVRA